MCCSQVTRAAETEAADVPMLKDVPNNPLEGCSSAPSDEAGGVFDIPSGLSPPEVNELHRRKALEFLRSKPLPKMIILRNILVPLQRLQRRQLWISSQAYERQQQALAARAIAAEAHFVRSYPLVELAEGNLEEECFDRLWMLLSSRELWAMMPLEAHTAAGVGLAFKIVSRAGALVNREMSVLHKKSPFLLFLLVRHPHFAAELAKVPECMLCHFAKELKSKHEFNSQEFRFIMLMLAKLVGTNIADIECLHASLRRLLLRIQSRPTEFDDLAAAWIGQRVRKRNAEVNMFRGKADRDGDVASAAECESELAANSAGDGRHKVPGPWRAFVAQETMGVVGRLDLHELGVRYRGLSDEEKSHLQKKSDVVARARNAGDDFRGFGGGGEVHCSGTARTTRSSSERSDALDKSW